jgi:hypothetical protein
MSLGNQPTPRQLMANVITAARDFRPRTVLDPREGFLYTARLTSRMVKLQGGLMLWAIMTPPVEPEAELASVDRIHAVA